MTREEAETIAKQAATQAVEQMLSKMGLEPDEHHESQADMAYLRRQRRASEKVGLALRISFFTTVATGAAAMIWIGLKHAFSNGSPPMH